MRAVRERIAIAAIGCVRDLAQTFGTRGQVGKDKGRGRASGDAFPNGKRRVADSGKYGLFNYLQLAMRRPFRDQAIKKSG